MGWPILRLQALPSPRTGTEAQGTGVVPSDVGADVPLCVSYTYLNTVGHHAGAQADRTLVAEQGARDFRPPEDGGDPPPLDRPTRACSLVAPLLGALLRLAAQHLQASNLASFGTEVHQRFRGVFPYGASPVFCPGEPDQDVNTGLSKVVDCSS